MSNINDINTYWQDVQERYNNYLADNKLKPADNDINDLINKAKKDFDLYNSNNRNYLLNTKKILCSLKIVKQYSFKQKTIIEKFKLILGISSDDKLKQINNLIQKKEKELHKLSEKRDKILQKFKHDDWNFLNILNKCKTNTDGFNSLNESEKKIISEYLKNIDKKTNLSKLIKLLEKEDKTVQFAFDHSLQSMAHTGIKVDRMDLKCLQKLISLHSFSKRKKLASFASKAENLLENYEKGKESKKEEKLNIREFALFDIIPDKIEIPPSIFNLAERRLLGDNMKALSKLSQLKSKMEKRIQEETFKYLPDGLSFQDMDRHVFVRHGGKSNFLIEAQRLTTQSNYRHVGVIYRDQKDVHQSHILGQYERDPIFFEDLVTNHFFALDWDKLISHENQEKLKKIYGEDWQKEIQKAYQKISQEFHGKGNFENLNNDLVYRILSVVKPSDAHSKKKLDISSFEDRMMFCSQFAAMSLVYTLTHLNRDIDYKLKAYNLKDKNDDNFVIQLPFEERTKFSSMHPGKLMEKLENYIKEVDLPPIVKHFVNFN